jgi:hypothetical protein
MVNALQLFVGESDLSFAKRGECLRPDEEIHPDEIAYDEESTSSLIRLKDEMQTASGRIDR